MGEQKRIFISYHRTAAKRPARIIAKYLRQNGYDVFLDEDSIPAGKFDAIIFNEIRKRPQFLIVLGRGSGARLGEPGDWVAKETMHAIEVGHNIIPVLYNRERMSDISTKFPKHGELQSYQALTLSRFFYSSDLKRLHTEFLSKPPVKQRVAFLAEEHWELASDALANDDLIIAELNISQAISLQTRPEYYLLLSEIKVRQDLHLQALQFLDQAISLDPLSDQLMDMKFVVLQNLDKLQQAIRWRGEWNKSAFEIANEAAANILKEIDVGHDLMEATESLWRFQKVLLDLPREERCLRILSDVCQYARIVTDFYSGESAQSPDGKRLWQVLNQSPAYAGFKR